MPDTPFHDGWQFDDSAERFDPIGVDDAGMLVERRRLGDAEVIVHHGDLPDSDITTVDGVPCTTALRTVIDIAADVGPIDLKVMVQDCLLRRLFTVDEARARLAQPDMVGRAGARLLRQALGF